MTTHTNSTAPDGPMQQPSALSASCAVTGAGGFIGSRLLSMWQAAGRSGDLAIVRREDAAARLRMLGARVAVADLLRPAALEPVLAGRDAVVHLAHGDRGPEATRNLLQAMARAGVRRLVHISTMSVHGPSPGAEAEREDTAKIGRYGNDYCDSKAEQEELVWAAQRRGDINCVILRPTVVYGPGSGFVSLVMDQAAAGEVSWVDEGSGLCNAIHVDDVCTAIDASLNSTVSGQAFFINGDEAILWRQFIEAFASAQPSAPRFVNIDSAAAAAYWAEHGVKQPPGLAERIVNKVKRLGGWTPAPPAFPPMGRVQRETIRINFSNAKARAVLGWVPAVGFDEGVRRTMDALRSSQLA